MPLLVTDLKLGIESSEYDLKTCIAKRLKVKHTDILSFRVVRMSLDARKKNELHFVYAAAVVLGARTEQILAKKGLPGVSLLPEKCSRTIPHGTLPLDKPIVIVGFGPGGLFAAYTLAKHGYKPIVIERGEPIERRSLSVEAFFSTARLDENSNVMFGEGGAGAFSDGKLTTRIKDERAAEVLEILAENGAPEDITVAAKPHIGTDILKSVVKNMRLRIEAMGGKVLFGTKLVGISRQSNGSIASVEVESAGVVSSIPCRACILAIGQAARDTYRMLSQLGIELAAKPFAVGVRIEHPQELINRAQYGDFFAHPRLGAAEYRLTGKSGERGVYSFCMCPGGVVVASSSGKGQVVTNGMSYHARDGRNANAAIVVSVNTSDFANDPLQGLCFQEKLEHDAFLLGGGNYSAPAERLYDFMHGAVPTGFGEVTPTYRPGVKAAALEECLPDFIAKGLYDGLYDFGRKIAGFDMGDAVLTAVETRTSSPVRIQRTELGEATQMQGLFPVGEGAGYAGGIVSAAVDGMRAAERIIAIYSEA